MHVIKQQGNESSGRLKRWWLFAFGRFGLFREGIERRRDRFCQRGFRFDGKVRDHLRAAVIKDFKIFALEICDGLSARVADHDADRDQIHAHGERDGCFVRVHLGNVGGRLLRRSGWGGRCRVSRTGTCGLRANCGGRAENRAQDQNIDTNSRWRKGPN